jgi:hypothetical protein
MDPGAPKVLGQPVPGKDAGSYLTYHGKGHSESAVTPYACAVPCAEDMWVRCTSQGRYRVLDTGSLAREHKFQSRLREPPVELQRLFSQDAAQHLTDVRLEVGVSRNESRGSSPAVFESKDDARDAGGCDGAETHGTRFDGRVERALG